MRRNGLPNWDANHMFLMEIVWTPVDGQSRWAAAFRLKDYYEAMQPHVLDKILTELPLSRNLTNWAWRLPRGKP